MLISPSGRALVGYGLVSTCARAVPLIALMGASFLIPAAEFGALAGVVAAVTLCIGIAEGGLDSSASLLVGSGRPAPATLSSLLTLRLMVAALLAVAVLPPLLLPLALPATATVLSLAAVAVVLSSIAATCRLRLRLESPAREMRVLAADRCVSAVPFLAGLVAGAELEALILLFLAGQALGCLLTILVIRPPRAGRSLARELITHALPFVASTVAANVTWRVGVIALGMKGAVEQAGYLATAIYPVQALVLVSAGSAPLILIGGRQGLSQLVPRRRAVGLLVAATALAATATAAIGPLVAPGDAVWTLTVLLCVLPMALANPLVGAGIRVHGHAGLVAGAAAAGATVAVLVSLTAELAAINALGIVIAETVVLTVMLVLSARHGSLRPVGAAS
ncbi:oligosaccharide flippase family protein [Nocardioides euryhalodurans]|uniref:Polysaccharide biosynthesis protein n=1 Tax=Nocardioides euryhalodurans TaxID=2518370 RepID=A0A4P7GMY2_9ACTN|nr:oligosaccharide flippase family protein [Nocardioides euryhalodurans]QBR93390.1 hypothetical protein EXE57_14780 [Nocardioides euryhalodurans]